MMNLVVYAYQQKLSRDKFVDDDVKEYIREITDRMWA
jgi:hypothetical protein